jgi:hypothetical protein
MLLRFLACRGISNNIFPLKTTANIQLLAEWWIGDGSFSAILTLLLTNGGKRTVPNPPHAFQFHGAKLQPSRITSNPHL